MEYRDHELPPLGPLGDDQERPRVRIPIRDRRKLYGHAEASGQAEAGGPAAASADETEAGDESAPPDVHEAEARAQAYLEDLQRLKAEFDNYRRRTAREQGQLREYVAGEIIGRLLGVLDNFQLAVAAAEDTRDFDAMFKGVQMVYRDLRGALQDIGLEPVNALGQPFDPNLHEAVEESEGDGSGVMAVQDILREGYTFKGNVLRPALVKVTQSAEAAEQPVD